MILEYLVKLECFLNPSTFSQTGMLPQSWYI